jgi:hypothetical protein
MQCLRCTSPTIGQKTSGLKAMLVVASRSFFETSAAAAGRT